MIGARRSGVAAHAATPHQSPETLIMSRHAVTSNNPALDIIVGWDPPLETFFAQVMRTDLTDDAHENHVVLWIGTANREIERAESLIGPLAPYGAVPPALVEMLDAERAQQHVEGRRPTRLQSILTALLGDGQ